MWARVSAQVRMWNIFMIRDLTHRYSERAAALGYAPATQGQDKDDPAGCTTKPGLIHANACDAHPRNSL